MRQDPSTGRSVPDTLGELEAWVNGEFDPALIGGAERKGDMRQAVAAMIEFTPGGRAAKLAPFRSFEELLGILVMKSGQFARARIREERSSQEPNDLTMETAKLVIQSGNKEKMRRFADQLEVAMRHPAVHPEKHAGLKKLIEYVRMNANGNC